ncbi:hypothetical protein BDV97DRAFT_153025 [Delphinella strobiligena]|nr:hypothetical protein BDV97DRAFT_153025 [Delphinella strobiligena]
MFSSQLGRVARASSSIPHPAAVHRTATACLAINATPASIQPKQRRYSSSKASSAPNGNSNGAKPLTDASESASGSKNNSGRRSGGRRARDVSYKPKKAGNGHVDGAFETLPRVAGTGHLHPLDISLSSFFSLHRPLSLTTPLPPTTTQESFAAIFDSKPKRASNNPNDVIYTLSNTIDTLDDAQDAQQDTTDLHWQVVQESPSNSEGIKHLDGAPRAKTIEEMVSQLRPFMTPPPPAAAQGMAASQKKTKKAVATGSADSKKSFQTTITVTENTDASGVKFYTANSTPMVPVPDANRATIQDAPMQQIQRQPFLERMHERQMEYEDYRAERDEERSMQLISVKRQRKLKMKKHKYKKLMKRTRNLRRRLDRN